MLVVFALGVSGCANKVETTVAKSPVVKISFSKFKTELNGHITKAPDSMKLMPMTHNLSSSSSQWQNFKLYENLLLLVKVEGGYVSQAVLVSASKDHSSDLQMIYVQNCLIKQFSPKIKKPDILLKSMIASIQKARSSSLKLEHLQDDVLYRMEGQGKITAFMAIQQA